MSSDGAIPVTAALSTSIGREAVVEGETFVTDQPPHPRPAVTLARVPVTERTD